MELVISPTVRRESDRLFLNLWHSNHCDIASSSYGKILKSTYRSVSQVASSAIANRLQKNFNDKDLALLEDCLSEMKKILFHHHHAISSFHDQLGYYYRLV